MVVITTLLTATSHLWHQWWLISLSTSLCVFTLPGESPCNVWRVWHAMHEMLTPRAPDLTFFWGFTLLHGLHFTPILSLSIGCPVISSTDQIVVTMVVVVVVVVYNRRIANTYIGLYIWHRLSWIAHRKTSRSKIFILKSQWYTTK